MVTISKSVIDFILLKSMTIILSWGGELEEFPAFLSHASSLCHIDPLGHSNISHMVGSIGTTHPYS